MQTPLFGPLGIIFSVSVMSDAVMKVHLYLSGVVAKTGLLTDSSF